jgi:hypothetical protein
VEEVVQSLDALPEADRRAAIARLIELGEYQGTIGWGYGDYLGDIAARLQEREDGSARSRHAV